MFDPFNDFNAAGYLRNVRKDKDEEIIKRFEHNLFRANLSDALEYLSKRNTLEYADFLEVHRILFNAYYPWAGQDRLITMPNSAVSKAGILFSHPADAKRAIDEGLRLGQKKEVMNTKPGEVMGLFAYGHPFLDGNGRTMLLVHHELTHRAGFSIAWSKTNKAEYLSSLSREIRKPGCGILDSYLLQFKDVQLDRTFWSMDVLTMKGLDGLDASNAVEGEMTNPFVAEKYQQFEQQRNYSYVKHDNLN
jgi:cell filamentation protein